MRRLKTYLGRGRLLLVAVAGLAMATLGADCQTRRDQPLTILLVEYRGPEAAPSGERLATELSSKGLKEVFVVKGPEVTSVCAGRFKTWQDPEARKLKQVVHQVRDASGQYPFYWARLVPVPEEAPRNEWPLEAAKGIYTLHIATWGLETTSRMASAQAYAKELRAKGHEAYVYHGPRFSMVTLGAFGPTAFDDPTKIGRPGVKPEIRDPALLALVQKFPTMKLDGEDTILPSLPVVIPGREPAAPIGPTTRAMYRVSLKLVDTKTGLPAPRGESTGVAQAKSQVPELLKGLVEQMLGGLPKGRKTARLGVVGVLPTDADAAKQEADRQVGEALVAVLNQAALDGRPVPIAVSAPEATGQILDAAGLKSVDVLRDARKAQGVAGLDYVVTGTVTVIPAR
jgi:hypothetical protein